MQLEHTHWYSACLHSNSKKIPFRVSDSLQGGSFTSPIVGGTGTLAGAQGTVEADVLEIGSAWTYTVNLKSAAYCSKDESYNSYWRWQLVRTFCCLGIWCTHEYVCVVAVTLRLQGCVLDAPLRG